MKIKVAVMFGGKSVEHEVSIISGIQAIANMDTDRYDILPIYITKQNEMYIGDNIGDINAYKNIDNLLKESQRVIMVNEDGHVKLLSFPFKLFKKPREIKIDVAFPIVHGTNVEDGTLQGFLKLLGLPFVGCDVTASAIGMDKYIMKTVLKDNNIPVLDCLHYTTADYKNINQMIENIEKELGYPVIVKPINLGSSVGIGLANDKNELLSAIDDAFLYANKVLVEHGIKNLREINCAVLGDVNEAIASECEEPLHKDEILSYEDKYLSNAKGGSKGMASVQRKLPADLTVEMREKIRSMAVEAFKQLGCNGVARIDFMIDEDNGSLYFNEINTIPGSLAFYLWEPIGMPYKELLNRLIDLALKRKREEENITFSFDTNILSMQSKGGFKGFKNAK
ncbi:MAG: D-alanine--D-alanine ligase [Clostridiales bacterium]|mgnify:CR=1 FL=1|nr:D-alanine--D-alanine ligase [Clostridiales bacterium]